MRHCRPGRIDRTQSCQDKKNPSSERSMAVHKTHRKGHSRRWHEANLALGRPACAS